MEPSHEETLRLNPCPVGTGGASASLEEGRQHHRRAEAAAAAEAAAEVWPERSEAASGSRSLLARPAYAAVGLLLLATAAAAAAVAAIGLRPSKAVLPPRAGESMISDIAEDPDCKGCAGKMRADENGVVANPDAFSGALTFEDVQNMQRAMQTSCPKKCSLKKAHHHARKKTAEDELMEDVDDSDLAELKAPKKKCRRRRRLTDGDCHTAKSGEKCHAMVKFTMEKGLDMYPSLSKKSSFEDVQGALHEERPEDCPSPCAPAARKPAKSKANKADNVVDEVLGSLGIGKEEELEGFGLDDDDDVEDAEEEDCDDEDTVQSLVEDVDHPPADCHTAKKGESCYEQVLYTQLHGLKDHPKWFKGLNSASSFEQIQAFLHKGGNKSAGHCPAPCAETCHDAIKGEPCHTSVDWAMKEGIEKRPDWYVGLTPKSSFKEVQYSIHNDDNAEVYCPQPCDFCHTAKEGERCFSAVDWVLKEGLDKQPAAYPGLNRFSSFEEVQNHLHKNRTEAAAKCAKPCPPPAPDFSAP